MLPDLPFFFNSVNPAEENYQLVISNNMGIFVTVPKLTLSQTTNFRLFQTESLQMTNFKFDENCRKVLQMGIKHCGKRRNCSLQANFFFSHSVFKRLVLQTRKFWACLEKG